MNCRKLLHTIALSVFLFIASAALAQDRTITGRVTDTSGRGIPGVSITVQGQQRGASTASDGSFSIPVPATATTLVFSSVGFATQQVPISGNASVEVTMQNVAGNLNEVVVIGYGTQRRRDLTGSITAVTSKDFQKGNITTPEQLIAGKVAGVQITPGSGAPGAGSRILIRGGASLNATNDPLIVVDGVPLDRTGISGSANWLNMINPNDIESFNILKDASAAAIYGSRASNGVIIITTKKGRRGKPVFSFSTQQSVSVNSNQVDVLSAEELRQVVNERGTASQKALVGTANTNWQDEIYRAAFSTDNNLSVSGSVNKLPFRASVGFLNQNGVLKRDNLKRYSSAVNLSPRLFNEHLRIDLNLKGSITENFFANQGAIGAAIAFDPTQNTTTGNKRFGGFFEWLDANGAPNQLASRNPLGLLNMREDESDVRRSIGNIQFDYMFHFLPALRANLNLGYDIAKGEGTTFIPDSAASNYGERGANNQYQQRNRNKLMEFYLNYAKDLGPQSSRLDVLAGYAYQDFLINNYFYPRFRANKDTIPGTIPRFLTDEPQNTLISFYGRLNYNLLDRYLITATLRRDGSSRFSPDTRWGVFPSAAFAWRLSNESFLKGNQTINDLKLRLGYGVTGQQDIGNDRYPYLARYSQSGNAAQYQLGNAFYYMYRPEAYDPNIKWEETATYNVGLDFGLWNNRVSGTLEYYIKKTEDLLSVVNIPVGTNFSNQIITNVGNMENRGVEFSLNTTPVRNDRLSWDFNFNVTYNQNEITNLTLARDTTFPGNPTGGISGGTGNQIQIHSVGHPRSAFYVYKQVYSQNGSPVEGLYVDQNSDGVINEKDLYRYQSPDPDVFLGVSSQVNYLKWNAGFVLRANFGNYMYNNVNSNLAVYNTIIGNTGYLVNGTRNVLNTNFRNNQYFTDYYIENASFLRMDNLYVGYNAGKVLRNAASLRLNFNVQNAFVITKYTGLDPEIAGGIDNNFYPRPRIFSLGVNLDF